MQLTVLDPFHPEQPFPSLTKALKEPNGLLAIGGCLSPQRLLNAYRNGIFPWYNPGEPLLWWSPNPRLVLFPEKVDISRSLRKTLRKPIFSVTYDQAFDRVVSCCAEPRAASEGTWITEEMKQAYLNLHRLGVAHSVEAWCEGELVGGLYGVALGQVFFGESMFHKRTDASKVAFVTMVKQLETWRYRLIDCQVQTQHLLSLGAEEISRQRFTELLERYCATEPAPTAWQN
ncbi:MAG: leucyl/phenylalanyl-tRNA--protein transferase [Methylomicrobium sp.]